MFRSVVTAAALLATLPLTAQGAGEGAAEGEMLRLAGPPREQITLAIEIDATDQLETGDAQAGTIGY